MIQRCDWCGNGTDKPITIGIAHANSGPGRTMYACPPCKTTKRLLPLDQHPADSFGFPRFDYAAAASAP